MKTILIVLAFLAISPWTSGQTLQQGSTGIAQEILSGNISCSDPRVLALSSKEGLPGVNQKNRNFINCVALRIIKGNRVVLPTGYGSTWIFAAVHNDTINSQTRPLPNGQLAVLAFDSMAAFLNYDQDEEAFVIAHEIGHVQDWADCQALRGQRANQPEMLRRFTMAKAQQTCEENADAYGLQYMWGARFNPFAAGGLLGRLQMYLPNDTRGMRSALNNLLSDHPISPERIKKLRVLMVQLCSRPGTVCHQ